MTADPRTAPQPDANDDPGTGDASPPGDDRPRQSRWGELTGRTLVASLALVALVVLLGTAVAWPPTSGSPVGDGPDDLDALATTAADMGYRVRATLLGADVAPTTDPTRTLYIVPADSGDGGPSPDRINRLLDHGARVLLADDGRGAELLRDHGWRLQPTPVYGADLQSQDITLVPLQWRVDGTMHTVRGAQPLPLVPASEEAQVEGTPITATNRSFADLDGDRTLTEADVRGPFTVGVDLALDGGGRLVYLTTTYPLTNAAADHPDAEAFREALLVSLLPEGGTVVIDASPAPRPAGLDATHQIARAGAWTATCLPCAAGLAAVATGVGAYLVHARDGVREGWTSHATDLEHVTYPTTDTDIPDANAPDDTTHQDDTPEEAPA